MAPEECLLWWDIEKHGQRVPSEAWLQDLRRNHRQATQWRPPVALGDDTEKQAPRSLGGARAGAESHPLVLCPPPLCLPGTGPAL